MLMDFLMALYLAVSSPRFLDRLNVTVPLGLWRLKNPGGALHHRMGTTKEDIPTLRITRTGLDALNLRQKTEGDLRKDGDVKMSGNPLKIKAFFDLIEEPDYWFEIVRP